MKDYLKKPIAQEQYNLLGTPQSIQRESTTQGLEMTRRSRSTTRHDDSLNNANNESGFTKKQKPGAGGNTGNNLG